MIEPRFPISAEQIDAVVADFYAFVREHPGLGPVFAAHVTDWPTHEAKSHGSGATRSCSSGPMTATQWPRIWPQVT